MKYYDFLSNINENDGYLHAMIRAIIFTAILMSAIAAKAQSPLYSGAQSNAHPFFSNAGQTADTNHLPKKWFITKYAGISTGFMAYKGGSTSFLSAPLELMINRQLTNNVFAFGGVSATPYILQGSGLFYPSAIGKNYGAMQTRNYGMNPAARVGVMYISNDRTFSISGSVSVSRSSYNSYFPMYGPINPHMQY